MPLASWLLLLAEGGCGGSGGVSIRWQAPPVTWAEHELRALEYVAKSYSTSQLPCHVAS